MTWRWPYRSKHVVGINLWKTNKAFHSTPVPVQPSLHKNKRKICKSQNIHIGSSNLCQRNVWSLFNRNKQPLNTNTKFAITCRPTLESSFVPKSHRKHLAGKVTDWSLKLTSTFQVCKSVHHHTIQINQPTRCNNFSSLLLDVYLQLNIFRPSSRPSSGAQELQ